MILIKLEDNYEFRTFIFRRIRSICLASIYLYFCKLLSALLKNKKDLIRQEKMFLIEFKQMPIAKTEITKQKELLKGVLSSKPAY